jgi:hypothetical protein
MLSRGWRTVRFAGREVNRNPAASVAELHALVVSIFGKQGAQQ